MGIDFSGLEVACGGLKLGGSRYALNMRRKCKMQILFLMGLF